MKISIEELGSIKQAEFTLGELTLICGRNNCGKTYAMHATYGFLEFIRSNVEFPIDDEIIEKLFTEGSVQILLSPYLESIEKLLDEVSNKYSEIIYNVFAGKPSLFKNSKLRLSLDDIESIRPSDVQIQLGSAERGLIDISLSEDRKYLNVSLIVEKNSPDIPPRQFLKRMIRRSIGEAIFEDIIPNPFLASAERTGAAIFQKELDFTKNRLVEMLGDKSTQLNPLQFLSKFSGEYPIAVRKNVDFIRDLPNITNRESFILKEHPDILEDFRAIIGGEYKISKDGETQYIPTNNSKVKLSLVESSSAVRSLLDIGFYLRHTAMPGDLLMIDEPELNLHPENQRRVARLLVRLVNIGIKVFVTTHSDYIIKELNTLIMLNKNDEICKKIAKQEGYKSSELLDYSKVRLYIAEEAPNTPGTRNRKTKSNTLVAAQIDSELGIEVRSFDVTIDDMNRIQDEIIWG